MENQGPAYIIIVIQWDEWPNQVSSSEKVFHPVTHITRACPTRETAYLTGVPYLSEKLFSVETSFVITTPRYWIGSDYVTVPDGMGPWLNTPRPPQGAQGKMKPQLHLTYRLGFFPPFIFLYSFTHYFQRLSLSGEILQRQTMFGVGQRERVRRQKKIVWRWWCNLSAGRKPNFSGFGTGRRQMKKLDVSWTPFFVS